ncbi:MAG: SDR family NAD(P)-dependent oxidoreductase [Deltaproteobacteria bacterium]|nr:SDR family NAD(P)-dependent oxidoreductase [Deltaproteobacteria bacterium]
MSLTNSPVSLTFVFRPDDISPSLINIAQNQGIRIVFDLGSQNPSDYQARLLIADASKDTVDLKISPKWLLNSDLVSTLREVDIRRVWVDLEPVCVLEQVITVLDQIVLLSKEFEIIPVLSDFNTIQEILHNYPEIGKIGLKGNEASGFVGSETILTLFSSVMSMIKQSGVDKDVFIWGGIAFPEAAAAFLCCGAKGIVFESLHWLTDLINIPDETRKRISNLRPDHTELTGGSLNVNVRVFNKGNSLSVRDVRAFSASLCGDEIRDEQRIFFAKHVLDKLTDPMKSVFAKDELIPLGIEAAFASSFIRRYGDSTEGAIQRFVSDIKKVTETADMKCSSFAQSATAKEMGTTYPFIQGAMSWITDSPEFASKISDAGALPTLALGLMDAETLSRKFSGLTELMRGKPYAVNIITLPENPYRDEQLDWVKSNRPRFAVIAAGEPSHAKSLMSDGIEAIYIAPNDELLRLALENGVKFIVLEGQESGGHVGIHSSITLIQLMLDLRDRKPDLFENKHLIVAGGFFDRLTSVIASILGADGLQMGTIYLASNEIVETGALSPTYQRRILEAKPGSTVITGASAGLRVRSLKTSKIDAICSLEREFASGSEEEASFRKKIEALSAGSLFVAAKGMDKPNGQLLDESAILEQGQFMSGACAGSIAEKVSLKQIHLDLACGCQAEDFPKKVIFPHSTAEDLSRDANSLQFGKVNKANVRKTEIPALDGLERIAITGMSVVNSLGNNPEQVIRASLGLKSGIISVPSDKWDHKAFFNSRPRTPEKTYCRFGAFQNLEISRKELGIPPQDFRTMSEATKVSMWLAKNAILESKILESDIPRERIAVLISQNSGEAASTLEEMIIRGCSEKILSDIKLVLNLSPEQELAVSQEIKKRRLGVDDTTLLGRLNCSAGGFICNKYGFMGPSFSVSAACATSLVALYSAYQMIRNGIIDAAVVGGGEELLTPMHFLEFSALGALAGLSGMDRAPAEASRPFDLERDGMVLGEGGAMIVIERESVARKRGANILAFITSMGASNNNLGMVESSRSTQEIAIKASFKDCSYGPESIDLVECHATSTKQGDMEEVQGLKSVFNCGKPPVLSSFKSQIGHTLGASGLNSLIRGVMAMNEGVYPPTLNYSKPDPEIGLEASGFRVCSDPADWHSRNGSPRRIQINAFGFGGSNYVAQIEEARDGRDTVLIPIPDKTPICPSAGPEASFPEGIYFLKREVADNKCRIAVIAQSEADAMRMVQKEDFGSSEGSLGEKRLKSLGRQGIHVGPMARPVPRMAFVFPGQGSHYAGMGHELYNNFPVIRQWMNRAAEVAEFDILKLLFFNNEEDLQKTRWQQPALFTLEYALVQYLISLGMRPTALAGHSLGELTALCLAGVYSFEDGFRIVNKRAICMDKACEINTDPGLMVACDAPMDVIDNILKDTGNVFITNINSPRQIVIGGGSDESKSVAARLKEMGYRSTVLRVSMAFHSPIMRCIHDELKEFIDGIEFHPPKLAVVSNTTMQPFPQDTGEIRRIVMAHLESPVHWLQNVQTLWNDYGVRLFVEVGPREILSNLIKDTIEESSCIQTCLPSAESLMLKTALAQLYAEGVLEVENVREIGGAPAGPKSTVSIQEQRPVNFTSRSQNLGFEQNGLGEIIKNEINAFVLDTFGKFIKPALLQKIQKQKNANFTEADLNKTISDLFGSVTHTAVHFDMGYDKPELMTSVPTSTSIPAQQAQLPVSTTGDTMEAIIRIIMEVTGYDRDEIEPHMDLREDLAIRSSRLPVIMDSVESHFGIKIELEDFMDVRTIKDLAERLDSVLSRQGATAEVVVPRYEKGKIEDIRNVQEETLKRLVFAEAPITNDSFQPLELSPLDSIVIIGPTTSEDLCRQAGDIFRRDYGVHIDFFFYNPSNSVSEGPVVDLLSDSDVAAIKESILRQESIAGLVLITDEVFETRYSDTAFLSDFLAGFFKIFKEFIDKPTKKMAVCLQAGAEAPSAFLEAVTGMFLSAALEFSSVQFRTMFLDSPADLRMALRSSMDRSKKPTQMICRDGELYALQGEVSPILVHDGPAGLQPGKNDVILVSGGLTGVSAELARALAPFRPKLIFVGRTPISSVPANVDDDERGRLSGNKLEEMRLEGIDAHYYKLDITDSDAVRSTLSEIAIQHGKITGVIHGAGLLLDNFIKRMSPRDFSTVVNVKFQGALNIFEALDKTALRFFVALSSAAAIQGNPGQVNYAAGNRMMSGLLRSLKSFHSRINFKALMLPPIEGAGMAENSEIRELMRRMNASYITINELSGMFLRELFNGPKGDVWTLFMKNLPSLDSAPLDTTPPMLDQDAFGAGTVEFSRSMFPMIDEVTDLNMDQGSLHAQRTFNQAKDLWVVDHKPFKILKHPIVSAIMALETFMEASKALFPYLTVTGIRDARFLDMMECPANQSIKSHILVKKIAESGGNVICDAVLFQNKNDDGKFLEKNHSNFKAQVVLSGRPLQPAVSFSGFPVLGNELDTRPMEHSEVLNWYSDRSDLKGRYQVMERLDGTGPDCINGEFIYKQSEDFSKPLKTRYQFSPYLFEAFMHLVNFYLAMRDDTEKRILIPFGINELACFRKITHGEKLLVQARKRGGDEKGVTWDALGLDENGEAVMYAKGIMMRWISGSLG